MGRKKKRNETSATRIALPAPPTKRGLTAALAHLRGRMIAGLLLVLPFVVTFWIVYWLYTTLDLYVISPVSRLVVRAATESRVDAVLEYVEMLEYIAPLVGLALVGLFLYFLGFVARSRVISLFDTFLLRVPIVTSIYGAASRMFQSLGATGDMSRFKRVVLVSFPHLGMRVPAFVTSSCRDLSTGRTILCVYVPTTPLPTSGYMLLVPEEEVTDLDWSLEETIQAVVSFGLTAPDEVRYYPPKGQAAPRVKDASRKG
jgi:uncharacterized membrane protein